MTSISCFDAWGNIVSVPAESICFRPAVYGILIENDRVLVVRHEESKLWHPPGIILQPRDTPSRALRRHFYWLTGALCKVGPLLYVEEQHRVDVQGDAWHLSIMYYAVERPAMAAAGRAEFEDAPETVMVPLDELRRSDMQFGYEAINTGRLGVGLDR